MRLRFPRFEVHLNLSATLISMISIKGAECTFEGGKFELCKWFKEQRVEEEEQRGQVGL